ncbi:MAG: arginine--tRNA ligase [Prevotellaceae bacterium]|jgi:arginyl-tRNA synthetase|nr:arginine--tRNA ligase [Prevotellaceae bacterium]
MNADKFIIDKLNEAIQSLYNAQVPQNFIQVQRTNREFEGDVTLVTFSLLKTSRKSPEQTANELGNWLQTNVSEVERFNVIKGFLNIKLQSSFWLSELQCIVNKDNYGVKPANSLGQRVMVEYSSPNTNKPLHMGHIRNILLGWSVSQILKANGYDVVMVNLVNDRGIHICKSMLAWQKFGNGETPESSGKKGDHLVGEYYVRFDKEYKAQINQLVKQGVGKEEAEKKVPILLEAQEMLRRWEAKDLEIIKLWETMNGWVYRGFDITYERLGVLFDKTYYESDTYLLGKDLVERGLAKGVFVKKDDGSVWVDLTADGLDQKLLLRSDGTSVYMTQDLGTAQQRFDEYHFNKHVYVVGNEQNYHFQVLMLILKKLGNAWADDIYHLSYGMVELPEGKMKSREGTVVDADDLIDEMVNTARSMSEELGKFDELTAADAYKVINMIGLGALKYFILKVDPKKTMLFDPKESIDFNGNTGSFIQYTHARIKSVLRKAAELELSADNRLPEAIQLNDKETELVKILTNFPEIVSQAGDNYSPALIANYIYDLAKTFNQFYQDYSILKEQDKNIQKFRIILSRQIVRVIKQGMLLLGITVPEKM